jgi:hypothetical protein
MYIDPLTKSEALSRGTINVTRSLLVNPDGELVSGETKRYCIIYLYGYFYRHNM